MTGPIAGVIGMPVAQSLSPLVHGTWLKRFGLPGRYEKREILPERFQEDVTALLQDDGWVGMNVTVPHKETAYDFCRVLDDAAQRLGAVNTIIRHDDGRIEGRNTDLYGFRANLEQAHGWGGIGRGPAVVLGAGGAARAVVAALQDLGFSEIRIINRNQERAQALALDLARGQTTPMQLLDYNDMSDALSGADLLVNTTSLGMTGQPPIDIELDALPRRAMVTDIVYKPLETGLLAQARARSNPTVDGLGMLLHQAVPGFIAWFNPPEPPTVDAALRNTVLAALKG
jgi:shikimate dehydrogenase